MKLQNLSLPGPSEWQAGSPPANWERGTQVKARYVLREGRGNTVLVWERLRPLYL